ncbi:hypothetical protein BN8_01385 [Fibrisoma limi BUZ 3]|uniref:Uncharacterized protein n=2 Tax=Fibrisoma limi TaxID=663275 RepID=I2GER0_9BACT|nr:hypothetical protein BN8_01385 [Fibrisoma limi BUZ 3]
MTKLLTFRPVCSLLSKQATDVMEKEQSAGQEYHGKEESTGNNGFLVSEKTENVSVDADKVDAEDHSVGSINGSEVDDYLGKTKKEGADKEE